MEVNLVNAVLIILIVISIIIIIILCSSKSSQQSECKKSLLIYKLGGLVIKPPIIQSNICIVQDTDSIFPEIVLNLSDYIIVGTFPVDFQSLIINGIEELPSFQILDCQEILDLNDSNWIPATGIIIENNGFGSIMVRTNVTPRTIRILLSISDIEGNSTQLSSLSFNFLQSEPPFLENCCVNGSFGEINFKSWVVEDLWPMEVAGAPGTLGIWTPSSDGRSVNQTGTYFLQVSVFYSDFDFGSCQTCEIPVRATNSSQAPNDDDFIGFVLGWEPGYSDNPNAEYLLIDWRRLDSIVDFGTFDPNGGADSVCTTGGNARTGLAVSRVFGTPTRDELWQHADLYSTGFVPEPS